MPADDLFAAEAEGLEALRERGALATPQVVLATRDVLVLSVLRARPAQEAFWEQFAHALARLHTSTVHDTAVRAAARRAAAPARLPDPR